MPVPGQASDPLLAFLEAKILSNEGRWAEASQAFEQASASSMSPTSISNTRGCCCAWRSFRDPRRGEPAWTRRLWRPRRRCDRRPATSTSCGFWPRCASSNPRSTLRRFLGSSGHARPVSRESVRPASGAHRGAVGSGVARARGGFADSRRCAGVAAAQPGARRCRGRGAASFGAGVGPRSCGPCRPRRGCRVRDRFARALEGRAGGARVSPRLGRSRTGSSRSGLGAGGAQRGAIRTEAEPEFLRRLAMCRYRDAEPEAALAILESAGDRDGLANASAVLGGSEKALFLLSIPDREGGAGTRGCPRRGDGSSHPHLDRGGVAVPDCGRKRSRSSLGRWSVRDASTKQPDGWKRRPTSGLASAWLHSPPRCACASPPRWRWPGNGNGCWSRWPPGCRGRCAGVAGSVPPSAVAGGVAGFLDSILPPATGGARTRPRSCGSGWSSEGKPARAAALFGAEAREPEMVARRAEALWRVGDRAAARTHLASLAEGDDDSLLAAGELAGQRLERFDDAVVAARRLLSRSKRSLPGATCWPPRSSETVRSPPRSRSSERYSSSTPSSLRRSNSSWGYVFAERREHLDEAVRLTRKGGRGGSGQRRLPGFPGAGRFGRGELDRAARPSERAVALESHDATLWDMWAMCARRAEQLAGARRAYEASLGLEPDEPRGENLEPQRLPE